MIQFFYILSNMCSCPYFYFSHSDSHAVTSHYNLNLCISLKANDFECLFLWLFVICISSSVKYPFKSFAYFLVGFWGSISFWVLRVLCIYSRSSPLTDLSYANIISWSVLSLFIFLTRCISQGSLETILIHIKKFIIRNWIIWLWRLRISKIELTR